MSEAIMDCQKMKIFRFNKQINNQIQYITTNDIVTLSRKQAELVIDTPAKEKLYNTMLQFGIEDVYMRMLNVGELMRVMGFPTSYKMPKSQTLAKKFIGNSVAVPVVEQLTKNLIN